MRRLEKLDPAGLTDEQREIYRRFTSGERVSANSAFSLVDADGRLEGPPNAWLLRPNIGRALEQLGGAMRYGLELSPRSREIAILLVAHHSRSEFELYAHTAAGRAVGLTESDLTALAEGERIAFESDEERAVFDATSRLLRDRTLDEDAYWSTVDAIGTAKLFELVMLVGYYQMLATQLSVFDVRPPQG